MIEAALPGLSPVLGKRPEGQGTLWGRCCEAPVESCARPREPEAELVPPAGTWKPPGSSFLAVLLACSGASIPE